MHLQISFLRMHQQHACVCLCLSLYRKTQFPFQQTQHSRSHLFAFTWHPHNRSEALVNHRGTKEKKKKNARRVLWIFHISFFSLFSAFVRNKNFL